jgi:hypothetical protein
MKRNDMQIGEKDIKNLFMIIMLEGEFFFWKGTFLFLFIWELPKYIPIWNCPKDNLWNLKLS